MTMDNVTFIETTDPLTNEVTEHAIIDKGNGNFESMTKIEYERRQAEQSTPIVPAE
jgi:hypothetical protein